MPRGLHVRQPASLETCPVAQPTVQIKGFVGVRQSVVSHDPMRSEVGGRWSTLLRHGSGGYGTAPSALEWLRHRQRHDCLRKTNHAG